MLIGMVLRLVSLVYNVFNGIDNVYVNDFKYHNSKQFGQDSAKPAQRNENYTVHLPKIIESVVSIVSRLLSF